MESLRPRGMIEYIEILWRKKLLIILVAASVSFATVLIIRRIPNIYESKALIVISSQRSGQGNGNEDQMLSSPSLTALTQRLTSDGNLTDIIRRYKLYPHPTTGRNHDSATALERLRRSVKIEIKMRNYYPDAPESVAISFRYTDPSIAQRVVADLVSIFEQTNATMRRQAATELGRFRDKIAEVETQLQALAPQRDLALQRNEVRPFDQDSSTIRAQRVAAASSIDTISDKEFMLERQVDEQKRQIDEQEKLVRSAGPVSALASNSAYGVLLARRAEVDAQLKDISTFATEKNPKMIQARTQLAAINREIARLEAAGGTNLGAAINSASPEGRELRVMQRELQRLETELEVTRRDLSRKTQSLKTLPKLFAENNSAQPSSGLLNDAKSEYDRLMGRYNWLMGKHDSLQMVSGDDGQKIALFQVIDAPQAQTAPIGPNRLSLKLLGLGIGLVLGLLIATTLEIPRLFRFQNDRDVEYYLGTPVLALIPETLTPFERGRRRRVWGLRWIGYGLMAVVMIPVVVTVLERTQIFQILANR